MTETTKNSSNKDKQKQPADEQVQSGWKRRILNVLLPEGDSEDAEDVNLKEAIKSVNGRWFIHQIPLLTLVLIGMLGLITNRYQSQQELIERDELEKEVADIRYRSLTRKSEITRSTRQSMIEEKLRSWGDTTLLPSVDAPFIINTNEQEK